MKTRKLLRLKPALLLAALLSAALVGLPQPLQAQLPSLGDAASSDLSPANERKLGDSIMREIRRDPDYLADPVLADYLNGIASRLAEHTNRYSDQAASIELFGVRDKNINAFALPGGYIGIHSALIANAKSESELASVVAHEIAHVSQRHIARLLAKQNQQSLISLGTAILAALVVSRSPDAAQAAVAIGQAAAIQGQLNFSRDMEREADRTGLQLLTDAGFSPPGMLSFFKTMQAASRLSDSGNFPYLRTHPLTTERIADVQSRLENAEPLTVGKPAFGARPLPLNGANNADNAAEFNLMSARARVLSHGNADGWQQARSGCRLGNSEQTQDAAGALYCDALASMKLRDFEAATKAANALLLRTQSPHAANRAALMLRAEVQTASGKAVDAARDLLAMRAREPLSRAVHIELAEAALVAQADALRPAREALFAWVAQRRDDNQAWLLLGKLHAALGEQGAALRATAESHLLLQQWPLAINLLEQARTFTHGDYFESSIIDSRLREARTRQKEEQDERRNGKRGSVG